MLMEKILLVVTASLAIGYDLRTRRIPNFITVPAMLLGLGLHAAEAGMPGFLDAIGGLSIGFGVLFVFYLVGGMGAGDVKLMGGMGALLGMEKTVTALIFMALAGGVLAVGIIAVNRAWKDTFSRLFLLVAVRGSSPDGSTGRADAGPLRLTVPYGVAIGAGSLLAMIFGAP